MFSTAYSIASQFTHPVIVSLRRWNGSVECALGAFVILNPEGWIATAAHLWDWHFEFEKHQPEISRRNQEAARIQENPMLTPKQKRKRIDKLGADPQWITNHSFWWGKDGFNVKETIMLKPADLAVGKLEPFEPTWVSSFPSIKDPSRGLNPGLSLCKLGFPFHEIKASYDAATDRFVISEGTFPIPRFPIEGIYTRNVLVRKSDEDVPDIKFLETSSPGLKGQSGGPIFDVKGTVWAIQSKTIHLELGFRPTVSKNGRKVEENQFLNVGWGVHPETLVWFLTKNGVKFTQSGY